MQLSIEDLQSTAITTISSETLSFVTQAGAADAGEAAGTVVYGQFANNKILNLLGNQMGEKSGTGIASSIVFTTGVMDSTLEVQWDKSGNDRNAQIAAMVTALSAVGVTNGSWTCHYPSGLVIVRKKTTGTTQAITSYKVRVSSSTITTGDIEIGAVELKNASSDDRAKISTAGADGVSNTQNQLEVGSRVSGFNGSTWDRLRAGITAVTSTFTGWLNTLPWAVYNATPTTRTEGQGGPLQSDDKGRLIVTLGTELAGENLTSDRLEISQAYNSTRITTATTTTVRSGAGTMHNILIEAALTGTVTIYDNNAGSGTIVTILPIGFPAGVYSLNWLFGTGCTLVTSAADRLVVSTLAR